MPATEQTRYNLGLLHKIFAVSGVVLLVATIWMFAKDHDRSWKRYQETFRDIEVAGARWQEIRAEAERNKEAGDRFKAELLVAQSTAPSQESLGTFLSELSAGGEENTAAAAAVQAAFDELTKAAPPEGGFADEAAESKWRRGAKQKRDALIARMAEPIARARFLEDSLLDQRKMKAANYDAAKSVLDLAIRDNVDLAEPQRNAEKVASELDALTLKYQTAAAHRKALQAALDDITAEERDLQKSLADNTAELHQIAKGLDDREAQWFEGWWFGKKVLEQPIADAFNSPLKIDNLWTDGLTHDMYNFKPVLRYDRCTTCHQAMEKTQRGSATEPLYEPEHELVVRLDTPTPEQLKEIAEEDRRLLDVVYGFQLASRGLLDREDVTINFVRSESRAAQAALVAEGQGVEYLARELVQSSIGEVFADRAAAPIYGLRVADVIVRVNDDLVDSQDDVRQMLLESVAWGEPVRLTVRRGYPHPYQTHPRLDLFVGSGSPHPKQRLGCTVCHEGQGSATDFKWASHYPDSLKEREQWRDEHGWFENHHWIYPMMPDRFNESTCLKCHHDVSELEASDRYPEAPAPSLIAGYNAVRRYGCFGCHEVVGFDGPDNRIGPDLRLEPNYFAAGLQLAFLADQRQAELGRSEAETVADEATADTDAGALDAAAVQLAEQIALLAEAKSLGERLGAATYDDSARRRLKEIVDRDKKLLAEYERAVAAGEEPPAEYVALFPPEAYEAADVLKDDETPGAFRKVGPSLRYIDAKVGAAFLDDWIREPKHFRPSSRMPQFFDLHDHLPGGEVGHTQQLEAAEIKGIRHYLLASSQPFAPVAAGGDAAVVAAIKAADADRGKVQFEIGGCLACHSNQDFPGQGNQGPDLTGLAAKLASEGGDKGPLWLYGWIQNPKRYHARTKMPVVPLKVLPGNEETDPIADVVAYLLSGETEWAPAEGAGQPVDEQGLDAITLMHLEKAFYAAEAEQFLKHGIPAARKDTLKGAEVELVVSDEAFAAGEALSQDQKLQYLGRKTIAKYGCYACHDVPGFEAAKP
ncbi:MAG: hypothetical protein KDA41_20035, partial [Planctomycetales bacterium]|nr:hypothetical protein [Planctomycetales bacterium]